MYLYDTPMDTMAKDLMLQSLCSTSIWNALGLMPNTSNSYNSCAPELMLNTKSHNSCATKIMLNTSSHNSGDSKLTLNTKSPHLCALGSTPNKL